MERGLLLPKRSLDILLARLGIENLDYIREEDNQPSIQEEQLRFFIREKS